MLYVFYGSDTAKVRSEALAKARALCVSGGEITHITPQTGAPELIKDAISTQSLFRPHEVFVLDTLSEDGESFETMIDLLGPLQDSENHIVLIEGAPTPTVLKKLTAAATDVVMCAKAETASYNPFGLADALLARDKKQLWILYQEGVRNGLSFEEMIGTLLWQLKVLRLVLRGLTPEESGLKPFVYNKAKRATSQFAADEPARLAHDLIHIYHRGHRGEGVLGDMLETWILKL